MKLFKTILKYVIIIAILVPLAVWGFSSLYSFAQISSDYPFKQMEDTSLIEENSNWMKKVSDNKVLSELALPGTHDSATQYVHLPYLAQCQALSIEQQLQAGYRYLDIRLKADPETKTMTFHHGPMACQTSYGPFAPSLDLNDGLEACYKFLKEHPSETIVFVVKQEDSKLASSDFQDILSQYVKQRPDAWYVNTKIPTLGEARGKIVLMQRYKLDKHYKIQGPTLLWEDQRQTKPDDSKPSFVRVTIPDSQNMAVQDAFQYSVEDKWQAFEDSSKYMSSSVDPRVVKINFLSTKGPTPFGHPYAYAKELNKKFDESKFNISHIWTIVDFATPEIASKIYKANF